MNSVSFVSRRLLLYVIKYILYNRYIFIYLFYIYIYIYRYIYFKSRGSQGCALCLLSVPLSGSRPAGGPSLGPQGHMVWAACPCSHHTPLQGSARHPRSQLQGCPTEPWHLMHTLLYIFFACGFPAPFFEKSIFSPLYCLCYFVKDSLTLFRQIYFWVLYSVLLIFFFFFSCSFTNTTLSWLL